VDTAKGTAVRKLVWSTGMWLIIACTLAACNPADQFQDVSVDPGNVRSSTNAPAGEGVEHATSSAEKQTTLRSLDQSASARPLSVIDVEKVSPAPGELVSLSPSGKMALTLDATEATLCTYEVGVSTDPLSCAANFEHAIHGRTARWSADETIVAFTEDLFAHRIDSDVWLLTIADGTLENLTDDGVSGPFSSGEGWQDWAPIVSPDGDRIAAMRLSAGQQWSLIVLRPVAGGGPSELGSIPGPAVTGGIWQPDGQRLWFAAGEQSDELGIWVMDTEYGSAPQQVIESGDHHVVDVTQDGSILLVGFYSRQGSQGAQPNLPMYGLADPETGRVTPLRRAAPAASLRYVSMGVPAFTPDGASVIYSYRTTPSIRLGPDGEPPGQLRIVQAPVQSVLAGEEREHTLIEDLWSEFPLDPETEYAPTIQDNGPNWSAWPRRLSDGQLVFPLVTGDPYRPSYVRLTLE